MEIKWKLWKQFWGKKGQISRAKIVTINAAKNTIWNDISRPKNTSIVTVETIWKLWKLFWGKKGQKAQNSFIVTVAKIIQQNLACGST